MDYLLEIAARLLPHVRETRLAVQTGSTASALQKLRSSFDDALARVYRRQLKREALRALEPATARDRDKSETAETWSQAPDVLAVEVLADVLAREGPIIAQALAEAKLAHFSPIFLDYLTDCIVEVAEPARLRVWKWLAANEHVNFIAHRRETVAQILVETETWTNASRASQITPPPPTSASAGGPPPETGGATASMLGTGDIRARAQQVKEQCARAASYVREKAWPAAEWKRVSQFLGSGEPQAQAFIAALKKELLGKPELVRRLSDATGVAVPFVFALDAELREIQKSRGARAPSLPPSGGAHAIRMAADMDLVGVALSGGGVRSATFNLGVIQALAHFGLLKRVDYLSTVSGGGYIGAWLTSWSKRVGGTKAHAGVRTVETRLHTEPVTQPDAIAVRAVRFLREYSNYLTPQAGFFTADTWTMIAIWLRNTMLNQAVLVLTLCGILAFPWTLWFIQFKLAETVSSGSTLAALPGCQTGLFESSPVLMMASAVLLIYAAAVAGQQLRRFGVSPLGRKRMAREMLGQGGVLFGIVAPVAAGAALLSTSLFDALGCAGTDAFDRSATRGLSLLFAVAMTVVAVGGHYPRCFLTERVSGAPTRGQRLTAAAWALLVIGMAIAASSYAGAAGIVAITRTIATAGIDVADLSFAFVSFGAPAVIAIFSLMVVLKIGILGRNLFDEQREWWSRLGAWLNIVTLAWVTVCVLALYSPLLVEVSRAAWGRFVVSSGGVGWALWTAAGVILGRRETNVNFGAASRPAGLRSSIVALAPYVFILGLLVLLSAATFEGFTSIARSDLRPIDLHSDHRFVGDHWQWMLLLAPSLLLGAFLLSWRVDVNEFSMHHFYKNRLVRCYLGASRDQRPNKPARSPDPFTGFDSGDDLKVACFRVKPLGDDRPAREAKRHDNPQDGLSYIGPLPIINAALNLVKGDDLAWQERKAQSFVFTPFYAGYDYRHRGALEARHAPYGFRPTALYAYPPFGIGLGTAVAISGAAASPNMGYHSSPPAAFLMTMFNARLGWWMGNPRDKHNWLRSGPRRGLLYLLNELFGLTNDRTHFVNLSDGGHFENLGIYELVRRRCRYIIACDAEQDARMTFNGLGNAIRKCRTDFGAEISICATRIRPVVESENSPVHCVLGDITYADGEKGTLLYLKASVTGDEPADVLEYAARERRFPHHSTMGDQFFDESQFESYRKLGFHVAHTAFAAPLRSANAAAGPAGTPAGLTALFEHLRDYWHQLNPALDQRRTTHAERYDDLLEHVMREPALSFVDDAFFNPAAADAADRPRLFVGALMLDLMQRVYIDLGLDNDRDHPHNAGWIAIFRRWKMHGTVQAAWEASADTYSRRFRWFYESL